MMENNKLDVLARVISERSAPPEYPDEAIFSDLYHTSLSTAIRAIDGFTGEEKRKRQSANEWISEKSSKACYIRVINFDRIVSFLTNGTTSCDALFYVFCHSNDQFHFLAEFKNIGKQEMLRLLKSEDRDGIYRKVKDSVENIRQHFLFGGTQESDDIIESTHFFAVYNGKNTAATSAKPIVPSKKNATRDSRGKQNRATRNWQHEYTLKEENEIYQRFSSKIEQLRLKPCTEDTFPGNAIPRVRKSAHSAEKIRFFTIFSAQDFGDLINSGFFDNWNWGPYLPDEEGLTENT